LKKIGGEGNNLMDSDSNMRQLSLASGKWEGIIHHYRRFLPVSDSTPVVTLCEGNTPLIRAKAIETLIGGSMRVYLKYEGTNPTGSFKDRGMTVAVSKALERNHKVGICASTGNTSASAAAYCAKANIKCVIVIPQGKVALGKLSQALAHGALLCPVAGSFDEALNVVRQICESEEIALLNSLNYERLEGQKTAVFEICDALSMAPDFHIMPVGNAGNITSHWMGYKEYYRNGFITSLPIMIGVQAQGAAPLVIGRPVENPETIATAIRIGNPARWREAIEARDESGGTIIAVTDEEIITAYKLLAQKEGLFVEPAGAASVAGLLKLCKEGFFESALAKRRANGSEPTVVCVLTGHGLKDPQTAMCLSSIPEPLPPTKEAILKVIKESLEEG
jgi:threonine synthase